LQATESIIGLLLQNDSQNIYRDKLNSFALKYWHYDNSSSKDPSVKMLISEAIRVYREIKVSTEMILKQMNNIASTLKEYDILKSMKGIGDNLASRFIAEVGNT